MSHETNTEQLLRRALGRAGIVLGYEHCGRKGAVTRRRPTTASSDGVLPAK
jgi:hypothetical protein